MNGIGRGSDDKQNKNKATIITRETVGMTLLLFGAVLFLITVTGPYLFGDIGVAITAFFVGLAGFWVYPLFLLLIYGAIVLVSGKKLIPRGWTTRIFLLLLAVFLIVHTATAERFFLDPEGSYAVGYGTYLGSCFSAAGESALAGTGGGILLGLVVYPVRFLLQAAGAYVLFSILLILALWFLLLLTPLRKYLTPSAYRKSSARKESAPAGKDFEDLPEPVRVSAPPSERPYERPSEPARAASYEQPAPYFAGRAVRQDEAYARSRDILFRDDPASSYRENLIYNADSRFNSQPRRSNVSVRGESQGSGESYSSRYTSEAENTRSPMPRRVTEEKQTGESGYSYPLREEYNENYPQTPSFRASIPAAPVRDFYENDVEPAPEDTFEEPIDEPAPARYDRLDDPASARYDRLDDPAPEEPPIDPPRVQSPLDREREMRDLFSRPVSDLSVGKDFPNTRLRDIPSDTDPFRRRRDLMGENSEIPDMDDTPADGAFSGEDLSSPIEDLPLGRGREIPPEEPAEEFPRSSRILDIDHNIDHRKSAADLFDDDDLPSEPAGRISAPLPRPAPEPEKPKPKKKHLWKKYRAPEIDLLDTREDKPVLTNEEVGRNSGIILDTLRRYGLETRVIGVCGGAAVTRYDLAMPERKTINMVTKYSGEIAMYLKVKNVNMYANPEVGGISVEVPNANRVTVGLKTVLESDTFKKPAPEGLVFALGQDLEGRSVCGDVTEMTHILVAGTTGSGKSITMHAMLISLLYKYSPEELRLILIDPKQSEFTIYEGLPHLMINEIITQAPKAVTALNWAIKEMERRYGLFNEKTRSGIAVRKIDEYNATLGEDEEKLPKILIVVDEFGDLMLVAKKDLEERIQRLTQKARAAGIHIVLATQRPSAEVVTGVIKSNLPTRIALSVDSELNSRIILDETGAETLLGKGDMLVKAGGKTKRVQGVYIGAAETQRVVNYIKENNESYYDSEISDFIDKQGGSGGSEGGFSDGDDGVSETYIKALGIVVKRGQASISLIQRSCGVGYNHAGKIIEWMESMGYISEFEGAKARTVLLTKEEYESKYGSLD